MDSPPTARSHLTLALCVILHAFTHAYGVLLVPLYLLMKSDLNLRGIKAAALVVTLYGVFYNLGSFLGGILADRIDRRLILGIGLIGNALAVIGMGLTRQYPALLAFAVLGGLFGALFHPAANALVCAHYPKTPGAAIGLLGIGSGLGFFAGPQFAGWRATRATWQFAAVSQWQKPCVELGFAGLVTAVIFLALAREAHEPRAAAASRHLGKRLLRLVLALSAVLGWRDFAALGTISLTSIYLQRACGKSVEQAGWIVGSMMLLGIAANPLAAFLSSGRRRLPSLSVACATGGIILATTPFWPIPLVMIPLCAYQTLQLGSYAISDAATLERVAPAVRGRVVGVFLGTAGTLAGLSPFIMGFWTDQLGPRATQPAGYSGPFLGLGIMMGIAAFAPFVLRRIGPPTGEKPITIAEEISPETMEGVA